MDDRKNQFSILISNVNWNSLLVFIKLIPWKEHPPVGKEFDVTSGDKHDTLVESGKQQWDKSLVWFKK